MELKRFQKEVINDLRDYLDAIDEHGGNYATAFASYRENRGVKIDPMGIHGLKPYNDVIKGCPQVCTKVPTAGGKTFIACNALREIFNHFAITKERLEAIEEVEGHEIEDGTLIVRVKPSKLRRRKNKVAYLIEMYEKAVAA